LSTVFDRNLLESRPFHARKSDLNLSNTKPDSAIQKKLENLYPRHKYFANNGILAILEKILEKSTIKCGIDGAQLPDQSETRSDIYLSSSSANCGKEHIEEMSMSDNNEGSVNLKIIADKKFLKGKFQEAAILYRKAIVENPDLVRSGLHINIAHSIILSTDWSEISRNLPSGMNYLSSSGWLNSLFLGKPVNYNSKPVPWYTYPAIEFIENKLSGDFCVFEYGSGQSSLWWAEKVKKVSSVESNPTWYSHIKEVMPDNVKLTLIEANEPYASEILRFPDNHFDCIIIDGINRNRCAEHCVTKLKQYGFIVFDNTDNSDFDEGVKFLLSKGFKRIDFYGLIPSYTYKNCTSVFFLEEELLSRGCLPSEKWSCLGMSCFQVANSRLGTNGTRMPPFNEKLNVIDWENLQHLHLVRLYAGDIPEKKEYDGLIGLSLTRSDHRHIKHDINDPLPLPDNSVDSYQAEDVFEHIEYDRLLSIIDEIYRVLKPNATFRLSVPDYACDVFSNRSVKKASGDSVFDPGGGGTRQNSGHVWFPRIDKVKQLLEKSIFGKYGKIEYLHYYNMDGTSVVNKIDYSKGYIQRMPDFDKRAQNPFRPMSIVIDLIKENKELQEAIILNKKGEELFSKGDVEVALTTFKKAIEIDPNIATAYNNLGVLCWQNGEVQKAMDHFKKALKIDPNDKDTIFNLGSVLTSLEKFEDARNIYLSYLKKNPEDEEMSRFLADLDKRLIEGSEYGS